MGNGFTWLICAMSAAVMNASSADQPDMSTVDIKGFQLVGIQVRTTNKAEMAGQGWIPRLWKRFGDERILERIPEKRDAQVYALFTDYESDRNGEYSYLIGAVVQHAHSIPPGMAAKDVPGGRYLLLRSEEGPFGKVVPEVWKRVWRLEDEGKIRRRYGSDFEVYEVINAEQQSGRIRLYVGIR